MTDAATWGLSGVTVRFGDRTALDDVSLEVRSGAVTAVVGGDGAGKTTLLRTLAGVQAPTSGAVRRPGPRRIGFVSAGTGVYRDLTVGENLEFVGGAYGLHPDALAVRAAPLLERTGLAEARDRLAGQLSGGMRQKLAFVLAIVHQPGLLILDEPTTGVDPVSRADLWRLVAATAAAGAAVVLATTYLDEAERAAHVLVLDEGRALATGPVDRIVASMPGTIAEAAARPGAGLLAWRRGRRWRLWLPPGSSPAATPGATAAPPDLADAVIVASYARRLARVASPPDAAA